MSIRSDIQNQVEDFLNEAITSSQSVSGGCIADSRLLTADSGNRYFLKTKSAGRSMFINEANGLKELRKAKAIRLPEVLLADEHFLLLEYIEQGGKSNGFFEEFGASFATMHRYTNEHFGFFEDNYIGASPQYNQAKGKEKTDWAEFYFQKRILVQYKFAERNGYATNELKKCISILESRIHKILSGSEETPSVLHGDLWGGNYLCDSSGHAVLIDPAVYYGHREADLAMTKMFGGFTSEFYHAYQEEYPLPDGWEYRENLYLLYHYMNHLNLFGQSYYGTSIRLLQGYV